MLGLFKRAPLTPAELEERKKAAAASVEARRGRHQAETTPSVTQGSSGAPSRAAVALFRQGQARPDTRARRSTWDTRTPEAPIGAMNATATFHFPKAYRGNPDRPRLGPRSMVMAMDRAQKAGLQHQDMVIQNPKDLAEAYRHPQMRQIMEDVGEVLRGHQKATIERGVENKLIPPGTHPAVAAQAYKHASLKALHKLGLLHYDHKMDDEAKRTMKPLVPFMFFAHRRVFDHLNQARLKGKWGPFRDEFGQLYRQKKHGKLTGHERMRMRPMGDFIKRAPSLHQEGGKVQPGQLASGMVAGSLAAHGAMRATKKPAGWLGRKYGRATEAGLRLAARKAGAHTHPFASQILRSQGKLARHIVHGGVRAGVIGAAAGTAALAGDFAGDYLARKLQGAKHKADNYRHMTLGGMVGGAAGMLLGHKMLGGKAVFRALRRSPIRASVSNLGAATAGGAAGEIAGNRLDDRTHLSHAVASVNRSLKLGKGVPRIGGCTVNLGDGRYEVLPVEQLEKINFNENPRTQLARAMHPRMRRNRLRLRLNTQKHIRRLTNGGVTRQERWMLFGKRDVTGKAGPGRLLTEDDVRAAARRVRAPTLAQREAGNYRKGHLSVGGLNITIETPKGRYRRGIDPDGRPWKVAMPAHYGYLKGSEGADGDHLDCYLGPHAHEADQHPVYVVDQHDADTGRFDEHKCMLGFHNRGSAAATYDDAFSDGRGPARRNAVHELTFDDFKRWVGSGDTTTPLKKGVILGAAGVYGGMKAGRFISQALRNYKVRTAARSLYREDLGNAIKQHLHVLNGGTASPHVKAAADRALRAAKLHAVQRARQMRNQGLAAVRPSKLAVAGGALGAGAVGALAGKRRPRQPPLYQSAQPDYQ